MGSNKYSAEKWDTEYESGRWDYLASLEQLPRYALLAAWCHRLCPQARILDVGCGEALLLEYLRGGRFVRYHGIDFAAAAVERARSRIIDTERETVECTSAEAFDVVAAAPTVVVFNESLNCFSDPTRLLQRYLKAVGAGFLLLSISNFDAALATEVRKTYIKRLAAAVSLEDRLVGKAWHLMALAGPSRPRR